MSKQGGLDPEPLVEVEERSGPRQISLGPRCYVWLPRWRHRLQMVTVNIGLWMKHSFRLGQARQATERKGVGRGCVHLRGAGGVISGTSHAGGGTMAHVALESTTHPVESMCVEAHCGKRGTQGGTRMCRSDATN